MLGTKPRDGGLNPCNTLNAGFTYIPDFELDSAGGYQDLYDRFIFVIKLDRCGEERSNQSRSFNRCGISRIGAYSWSEWLNIGDPIRAVIGAGAANR